MFVASSNVNRVATLIPRLGYNDALNGAENVQTTLQQLVKTAAAAGTVSGSNI